MKLSLHNYFIIGFFIIVNSSIFAQGPGCPNVDAGLDANVDCTNTCVDLTATYLQTGETTSYQVDPIAYAPPFPFTGLPNNINTGIDDSWTNPIDLPFDFCFFGDVYTQIQVGSNGVIRFDVDPTDVGAASNDWGFTLDIPDNSDPALGEVNIFGVGHDIDPSIAASNPEMTWDITGTAPCRTFVVAFANVTHFGSACSAFTSTSQIVLYETTNAIEIYVQDKPVCTAWNSGNAIIGIQNNPGTVAFVAPGRNTSDSPWATNDEAWRFTPNDTPNSVLTWFDDLGTNLGNTNTINVCPTSDTTYTAEVEYTNCNGDIITVSDDVLVTAAVPFSVSLGPDQDWCIGDADVLLDADIGSGTAGYQWLLNGTPIGGETNSNLTVSSPNSGTYSVEVTDQGCTITEDIVITFHSVPVVNPIADYLLCDDAVVDGFTQFDLSTKDVEALGAQTGVTVTYHISQADADAQANPLANLYTNISNPQTIYVRLETDTNTNCYVTTTFDLVVGAAITANQPPDLRLCDDASNDGIELFDLDTQTATVLGGQTAVTITYHLSQADADSDINPLVSPYTNIANPQIIYVRAEDDTNVLCFSSTTFQLFVDMGPVANQPPDLATCDDPSNDGTEPFDLEIQTPIVLGAQLPTDFNVTYHLTQADADGDLNPLASPYNSVAPYPQTIYVRIESANNATCFATTTFSLTVAPAPTATQPPDLEVCDDISNDGTEIFDLTIQTATILGAQLPADYTVTYHETQTDAETDINAIVTPAAYSNIANPQTIHVRVEDNLNPFCYGYTSFQLIVNPLPTVVAPTPFVLCDDSVADGFTAFDLSLKDDEIRGGNAGFSVSYHLTLADAITNINPLAIPYTNIANPQTIFARVNNITTGCFNTTTLDLQVEALPVAFTPTPLEYCDPDNDGFGEFTLTDADAQVTGGAPGLIVTYHETLTDAQNDVVALASPYNNIVAYNQTVYVRVENAAGCYVIEQLDLIVLDSPQVPPTITDYVICDTDNDGFAIFDLTTKGPEIWGAQVPANFPITYHLTLADANAGINPILAPANYTNIVNPQIIYVRMNSVANVCFDTGQFNLVVELPPVVTTPTPLEICDDDFYAAMDGFATFDLTVKDSEITGGNGSWTVSYYETNADAIADTNTISPATAYVNIANAQTLYVRVTDTNNSCFAFTTLTIRVLNNPTPNPNPDDIIVCDDVNTGDDQEVFDLTTNEIQIINGEVGVTPTYHVSLSDADAGINAIAAPTTYTNIINPQTIYVRVTNDITGCYTIVDFDLIINPLPAVIAVTDLIECEINTDGFFAFDLESKTAEVLNGQDPLIFAVTYHVSQTDADANINALVSPYINLTNPQQIFVSITNTNTGCAISTVSFNIEVQNGATATLPANEYIICDNIGDNDGFGQFDLTTQDAEILGGQAAIDYTVSYYLTQSDADNGLNAIPNTYENVVNPQTIYARVDNNNSTCFATTMLTLRVNLLPIFNLDDNYIICVNTNGTETISTPPLLDTGLSAADYTFEWTESGDPSTVLGTGSSYTANQAGTYTVLVTDNTTTCQNSDTAVVNQSSPPVVVATVTSQAFANSHTIEAEATGDGVYEFSLDGGPWLSNTPNDNRYTFTNVTSGEHTITARDINGCGEDSDTVLVIDYPLYFTPNGDGFHDTWNVIGVTNLNGVKIHIFDRYGKLLKQLDPSGNGWTGNYNGYPLPSSDYWFTIDYMEPSDGVLKQLKAHFALKR